MLRRVTKSGFSVPRSVAVASSSAASSSSSPSFMMITPRQTQTKQEFCECITACPLLGHFGSITAISSSNLLFSPIGTIALCAMAYNFSYVGLKHLWYTAEFPMRDYVQDVALKQVMRYLMLIALLLSANGLLCEP